MSENYHSPSKKKPKLMISAGDNSGSSSSSSTQQQQQSLCKRSIPTNSWYLIVDFLQFQEVLLARLVCQKWNDGLIHHGISKQKCIDYTAKILGKQNISILTDYSSSSSSWASQLINNDNKERIKKLWEKVMMIQNDNTNPNNNNNNIATTTHFGTMVRVLRVAHHLPQQMGICFLNNREEVGLVRRCPFGMTWNPNTQSSEPIVFDGDDDAKNRNLPIDLHCPLCCNGSSSSSNSIASSSLRLTDISYQGLPTTPEEDASHNIYTLTLTPAAVMKKETAAAAGPSSSSATATASTATTISSPSSSSFFPPPHYQDLAGTSIEQSISISMNFSTDSSDSDPSAAADADGPTEIPLPQRLPHPKPYLKHAMTIHCIRCNQFALIAPAGLCWSDQYPCKSRSKVFPFHPHRHRHPSASSFESLSSENNKKETNSHNVDGGCDDDDDDDNTTNNNKIKTTLSSPVVSWNMGGMLVRTKCSEKKCKRPVFCMECSHSTQHFLYPPPNPPPPPPPPPPAVQQQHQQQPEEGQQQQQQDHAAANNNLNDDATNGNVDDAAAAAPRPPPQQQPFIRHSSRCDSCKLDYCAGHAWLSTVCHHW